jgi:hypothetical protein
VGKGLASQRDRDDHLPANIVKASCSRLALGNTELARYERHERRDDHFSVVVKASCKQVSKAWAMHYELGTGITSRRTDHFLELAKASFRGMGMGDKQWLGK